MPVAEDPLFPTPTMHVGVSFCLSNKLKPNDSFFWPSLGPYLLPTTTRTSMYCCMTKQSSHLSMITLLFPFHSVTCLPVDADASSARQHRISAADMEQQRLRAESWLQAESGRGPSTCRFQQQRLRQLPAAASRHQHNSTLHGPCGINFTKGFLQATCHTLLGGGT